MIFSFLIPVCLGYLVSFKDLNYSQDHAILFTKSSNTQESFSSSIQSSPFQCTYLLCYQDSLCNLTSDSKLIVSLNHTYSTYTWDFTQSSFTAFFQKITSPPITPINSTDSYDLLSSHTQSFLFYYTTDQELQNFSPIAEKYKTTHLYFGSAFNTTFEHKQKFLSSELRLLGVDQIFKHSAQDNYEAFIEKFKCPLLLEYQEALWVEDCMKDKIVVTSVLNKRRKHMWSLYGGKLKVIAQELNDTSFQMMYVDNRKQESYLKEHEIPFVPFVLVHDKRINKTFYLGEFSLKSVKKVAKLLGDIKSYRVFPEDYTIDKIEYTHYLNFWQMVPLMVLFFGLLVLSAVCYQTTFEKVKIN